MVAKKLKPLTPVEFRRMLRQAFLMIVDAIERLDVDEYRDRTAEQRKALRSLREELRQVRGMD